MASTENIPRALSTVSSSHPLATMAPPGTFDVGRLAREAAATAAAAAGARISLPSTIVENNAMTSSKLVKRKLHQRLMAVQEKKRRMEERFNPSIDDGDFCEDRTDGIKASSLVNGVVYGAIKDTAHSRTCSGEIKAGDVELNTFQDVMTMNNPMRRNPEFSENVQMQLVTFGDVRRTWKDRTTTMRSAENPASGRFAGSSIPEEFRLQTPVSESVALTNQVTRTEDVLEEIPSSELPKVRKKKPTRKPKVRKIKFHEYKGPIRRTRSNSTNRSTSGSTANRVKTIDRISQRQPTSSESGTEEQQKNILKLQMAMSMSQELQKLGSAHILSSLSSSSSSSSSCSPLLLDKPSQSIFSSPSSSLNKSSNGHSLEHLSGMRSNEPLMICLSRQSQGVANAGTTAPILPVPSRLKEKSFSSCPVVLNGTKGNTVSQPPPPPPTNLDDLKVTELKQECKKRKLPVSGPKPRLVGRLAPYAEEIIRQKNPSYLEPLVLSSVSSSVSFPSSYSSPPGHASSSLKNAASSTYNNNNHCSSSEAHLSSHASSSLNHAPTSSSNAPSSLNHAPPMLRHAPSSENYASSYVCPVLSSSCSVMTSISSDAVVLNHLRKDSSRTTGCCISSAMLAGLPIPPSFKTLSPNFQSLTPPSLLKMDSTVALANSENREISTVAPPPSKMLTNRQKIDVRQSNSWMKFYQSSSNVGPSEAGLSNPDVVTESQTCYEISPSNCDGETSEIAIKTEANLLVQTPISGNSICNALEQEVLYGCESTLCQTASHKDKKKKKKKKATSFANQTVIDVTPHSSDVAPAFSSEPFHLEIAKSSVQQLLLTPPRTPTTLNNVFSSSNYSRHGETVEDSLREYINTLSRQIGKAFPGRCADGGRTIPLSHAEIWILQEKQIVELQGQLQKSKVELSNARRKVSVEEGCEVTLPPLIGGTVAVFPRLLQQSSSVSCTSADVSTRQRIDSIPLLTTQLWDSKRTVASDDDELRSPAACPTQSSQTLENLQLPSSSSSSSLSFSDQIFYDNISFPSLVSVDHQLRKVSEELNDVDEGPCQFIPNKEPPKYHEAILQKLLQRKAVVMDTVAYDDSFHSGDLLINPEEIEDILEVLYRSGDLSLDDIQRGFYSEKHIKEEDENSSDDAQLSADSVKSPKLRLEPDYVIDDDFVLLLSSAAASVSCLGSAGNDKDFLGDDSLGRQRSTNGSSGSIAIRDSNPPNVEGHRACRPSYLSQSTRQTHLPLSESRAPPPAEMDDLTATSNFSQFAWLEPEIQTDFFCGESSVSLTGSSGSYDLSLEKIGLEKPEMVGTSSDWPPKKYHYASNSVVLTPCISTCPSNESSNEETSDCGNSAFGSFPEFHAGTATPNYSNLPEFHIGATSPTFSSIPAFHVGPSSPRTGELYGGVTEESDDENPIEDSKEDFAWMDVFVDSERFTGMTTTSSSALNNKSCFIEEQLL